MKIKKFSARNVHGFINFEIEFYPDLTFLIGINGSGKTSALKLILGLVAPSYLYLNQIDFETAELVCTSENGKEIKIIASLVDEENGKLLLTYIGENNDKVEDEFEKIPYRYLEIIDEEINERFASFIRKFENSNTVKQIRSIATPVFLGLDRRINEEREKFLDKRRGIFPTHKYSRISQDDAINFSLRDIQELIFNYIRQLPFKQNRFTEEFKSKIFSTSFDFVETMEDLDKVDIQEIQLKKETVQKAIENLNIGDINKKILEFFDKIEIVGNSAAPILKRKKGVSSKEEIDIMNKWFINSPQLKRIDSIIKLSQEYQSKITELTEPIERLKSLISNFFKEGKKELIVKSDGELRIKIGEKEANIFELSSGEKQILIMIAHLIFYEAQKQSGIFIIDEPELSLHLAWQEIFVSSILQASPNTQFILATHSPAIIANIENEKNCQDLTRI